MLNAPVFPEGIAPDYLDEKYLLSFFSRIFNQKLVNAYRRTQYGFMGAYNNNIKELIKDVHSYRYAVSGLKGTLHFALNQFIKRFYK
jgi:hypothetical protein